MVGEIARGVKKATPGGRSATGGAAAVGGYRPSLDGVRAVAVLAVLGYHAQLPHADGGFLGVSLFFTLSGYLITAILLAEHERTGGVDLGRFWVRRIRRLVPAALLGVAIALVFGATIATRSQLDGLPAEALAGSLYVANWLFITTDQSYAELFSSPSPLQHYWSLAIEEQFYVVLPLLVTGILAFRRSVRLLLVAFVAVAAVSTAWMWSADAGGASLDRLYYGTDTRAAELAIGAALAAALHLVGLEWLRARIRPLAVIGPLAFGALLWAWSSQSLSSSTLFRGGFALHAIGSALVIAALLAEAGPMHRVLGAAPLAFIGRISYGIYLFHWPIFLWLTEDRTGLEQWPLFGLRLLVSVGVAFLSYRMLEQPIRNGARLGVPTVVRGLAVPGVALALFAGALVVEDRDAFDEAATIRVEENSLGIPIVADDGVLDLLAIADERGLASLDALQRRIADDATVTMTIASPFSCASSPSSDGPPGCENWDSEWPTLIADHDPDVVLLHVGGWPEDESAPDGARERLAGGLDHLTAGGATVVWVPTPATVEERFARAGAGFETEMGVLVSSRQDLVQVSYSRLLPPDDPGHLDAAASALLEEAALHQRSDRTGLPRVLVVGDSQARSLGFGLAQWGEAERSAWVWNRGTPGCPFAVDGVVRFLGEEPVKESCREAVVAHARDVASFQPEVVVALTGLWDLLPRKLDEWATFRALGDPDFDAYLLGELRATQQRLSAGGATVVWMTAPCLGPGSSLDGDAIASETSLRRQFNDTVLADLLAQEPDAQLFDLDATLCPDGDPMGEVDGVGQLRYDGLHFTVPGAYWFAETYGPRLVRPTDGDDRGQ